MAELALTLLPSTETSLQDRKLKDNFLRTIKNHTYARTNQFAVDEHLTGLEEKFQVLNLDDLAAKLYSCRIELRSHDDHWIPDVLDLLLHLSDNPAKNSRVDDLATGRLAQQIPELLTWKEVEADDPIDRQDSIWKIPSYSDLSSDEDEADSGALSSAATSPDRLINKALDGKLSARLLDDFDPSLRSSISQLDKTQFWRLPGPEVCLTEKQAIQEVLLMLQGIPTSIFNILPQAIEPNPRYRLEHLNATASSSLLSEAALLGSQINSIRVWLHLRQESNVMQLIEDRIRESLSAIDLSFSTMQDRILQRLPSAGIESLFQVLHLARSTSLPLRNMLRILPLLPPSDPVTALDTLFAFVDSTYSCYDEKTLEIALPILIAAFQLYAKPIDTWISTGSIREDGVRLFISENPRPVERLTLWHNWVHITPDDETRIPSLLKSAAKNILTIGKTTAFLAQLQPGSGAVEAIDPLAVSAKEAFDLTQQSSTSFCAIFDMIVNRHLTAALANATAKLTMLLEENCGFSRLLDALEHVFLCKNGAVWQRFESRVFEQIDRCVEVWNDRFLCADALFDTFSSVECVDPELITVRSAYTSSRTMESRRRSVKILSALTVSYEVSWPIANVIRPGSIVSYQKIALLLSQLRRVKFSLERRAYFCTQNISLGAGHVQTTARALCFQLSFFINTVYNHLTGCVIDSLTSSARARLSGTIDEMIAVHADYIATLEHGCLCSKRIQPLREALISAMDLCIRFTDIVSSPLTRQGPHLDDFEAGSFISAHSQRYRKRRRAAESESSSEEEETSDGGDGYSTFILGEDTSILDELVRVKYDFRKHVAFLTAGLRGVARNSGETGDLFELLADALEGVLPQARRVVSL